MQCNVSYPLFIGTGEAIKKYEYAVLVTNLSEEILTIAQHYRDRADCENIFDELKNQWGWGGCTTKDIKTALTRLSSFLNIIKTVAEQLSVEERCMLILKQAFSEMLQNWSNKWLKLLPSLT